MNEEYEEIENMEPDATSVEKKKDFGNFSDLMGDGKSITMVKIQKLKAPKDLKEMDEMDDDIQDETSVDFNRLINKLMRK